MAPSGRSPSTTASFLRRTFSQRIRLCTRTYRGGPGPAPRRRAVRDPWADPVAVRWLAARYVVAVVWLVVVHIGAQEGHRFVVVVDSAAVEAGRVGGDRDVPGVQIALGVDGAAVPAG